jgi:uncharacterized membrane protein
MFLFFVTFLNFPTEIMGTHGDQLAAIIFYSLSMTAVGVSQYLLWRYVVKNKLIFSDTSSDTIKYFYKISLFIPLIFLISVPVAFFSPTVASLFWIILVFKKNILGVFPDKKLK